MPIENVSIGKYRETGSIIHRLDPRTKGFCAVSLMAATFTVDNFTGLAAAVVLALALVITAKVGMVDFLGNLRAFTWLFVITIALHLFFGPKQGDFFTLPYVGWQINSTGATRGLFYSIRIVLLLAYSYVFMAVTSPLEIADGLERVLKPLKKVGFPAHETAMVLSIALRFVPTILDEAVRIKRAQLCRGARLEGNIIFKIKGFASMLIPLFTSAFHRADNLALAMEARGYRGGEGRTSFVELSFKFRDFVAIMATAGVIAVLVVI